MTTEDLFAGWWGLVRVLVAGAGAYVFIVVALRSTGKRTLSKLNAFDLIVTVALGSTLASILTSKSLALAEGVLALSLLIGLLQYVVTFVSVRSRRFDRLVKSEPALLLRDGHPLEGALRRERVTEDELRAAVRQAGGSELSSASLVVLESDGSLTAVLRS